MTQPLVGIINRRTNLKLFLISAVVLITVLLSLYILQISLMIKGTVLAEDCENKIGEITKQNKNLEIIFSQKNSLKITENLLEDLKFEKVTKIDYIRVLELSMAAK